MTRTNPIQNSQSRCGGSDGVVNRSRSCCFDGCGRIVWRQLVLLLVIVTTWTSTSASSSSSSNTIIWKVDAFSTTRRVRPTPPSQQQQQQQNRRQQKLALLTSSSSSSSSSSSQPRYGGWRKSFGGGVGGGVSTCRRMTETDNEGRDATTVTATPSAAAATIATDKDGGVVVDLNEVDRLKREAERMRLQADQMDLNLTLEKIDALERKLNNRSWLDRHPDAEKVLREQLQRLNDKFAQKMNTGGSGGGSSSSSTANSATSQSNVSTASAAPISTTSTTDDPVSESSSLAGTSSPKPPSTPTSTLSDTTSTTTWGDRSDTKNNNSKSKKSLIPPIAGFDQADLDLYIPVANDINKMSSSNGGVPLSLNQRIELFRTAPELQEHFQAKLTKLLMGPIAEMERLEKVKQQYLKSTSSKERQNLKRQIDKLEESIKDGGPLGYSESICVPEDVLPPLTEEALDERINAIQSLPDILIATYMQRTGVAYRGAIIGPFAEGEGPEDDDSTNAMVDDTKEDVYDIDKIRLAIQLDYYDMQVQLLDQARTLQPLSDSQKEDFIKGYNALPDAVKRRFATNIGMTSPDGGPVVVTPGPDEVMEKLLKRDSSFSPLLQAIQDSNEASDPPEYNDIEFVDRSRYLEELFPAIERLEAKRPSEEDVALFANEILGKGKVFMVTNKPERVIGGYYIRGQNLLSDDSDEGGAMKSAADKLVESVTSRLQSNVDGNNLNDRLDFFYILDPQTPTDEEIEMGMDSSPLFVVTGKSEKDLYQLSRPLTKSLVTLGGLGSAFVFSVGSCVLNNRIGDALESGASSGSIDISWFFNLCLPLYGSLGAVILAHEVAHRLVASYYKFDVGIPNVIPSIQTGLVGTITPIKSPPPSSKALFDFAIAGPLAGFAVSLVLLFNGLELTQHISLNSPLPVLPVDLVRSSSLGGGLVQFFLGKLAILPDQGPNAVVELHPTAIAGIIGCFINALALLPIGHTDGGRISLAMFGRRGAYVNQVAAILLLVLAGLFGLDDSNILLLYTLYAMIWQRELESPVRNEVDEIDISRGLVAIAASLLVGLTLIPMF